MSLAPAFSGQPLDRADPLRSDPARLAELLADDARLLKLDGLVPELDGDGRLDWQPVNGIQAELVFLGIAQGRAHFAAVPGEGNAEPAYAQRTIWAMLGRLSADDLALYGTARSVWVAPAVLSISLRLPTSRCRSPPELPPCVGTSSLSSSSIISLSG